MPQNNVVFIDSSRQNVPTITGQVNSLNAALYQLLCTGCNSGATTAVTRSGTTVTVARSGHGFRTHDWVLLAGITPADYNGMWRVTGYTVNDFTFTIAGTPGDASVQGTCAFAPLGWTRVYTGSNKSFYQGDDQSSLLPLYVDDSGAIGSQSYRGAWVCGFESQTDGVGTNPWPTVAQAANGLYWNKSSTLDGTARSWWIRGDGKKFLMGIQWLAGTARADVVGFGNYGNDIPGNSFNGFIIGATSDSQSATGSVNEFAALLNLGNVTTVNHGRFLCRKYDGTGSAITFGMSTKNDAVSSYLGYSGLPGANPATSGYIISPISIHAGTPLASASFYSRKFPGAYNLLHDRLFSNYDILPEYPELPGRRLMAFAIAGSGVECRLVLDITGPD